MEDAVKKALLLLLLLSLFSCYQAPVSNQGALSVIIDTDVIKIPPVRGDTELVLRLFNSGEFEVDPDSINGISYLSGFPETVAINNNKKISIPVDGDTGQILISGIPGGKELNLLAEFYGEGIYNPYYLAYAGLSSPFTVENSSPVQVSVTLLQTAKATIIVNKPEEADFTGEDFVSAYSPEDMASYINLNTPSEGKITFNREPTTKIMVNENSIDDGSPDTMTFTGTAVAGKKMQIIVSDLVNTPVLTPGSYFGISDVFEVQPGVTVRIPVSYYYYQPTAD